MTWGTISGGPINFVTWSSLYPYNYSSNYGGQYQFNVMPSYLTPSQAFGIQNVFNPFYHFAQMVGNFNNMFNPFANMNQMMLNQAAYANGYAIGENIGNSVIIESVAGNVSALKGQLEEALTSDKLTGEQKNELKALKREVETLEDRIKDVAGLQNYGATSAQIKAGISQINEQYRELRDKIQSKAEEIQEEIKASAPETVQESTEEDSESSDLVEQLDDDTLDVKQESRIICDAFADSIDGWGTKDKDFEEVLSYINPANIIEVMQQWDKTYKNEYDKSFIQSFMSDASHKQKRDFGKYLVEQLLVRADYNGIDVDAQVAKIRTELNSMFINDKKVIENFDTIYQAIIAAETAE